MVDKGNGKTENKNPDTVCVSRRWSGGNILSNDWVQRISNSLRTYVYVAS